jgi:hypothetical protein
MKPAVLGALPPSPFGRPPRRYFRREEDKGAALAILLFKNTQYDLYTRAEAEGFSLS